MNDSYTAAQVRMVLDRTDQLMCEAAGFNPLSGAVPEREAYSRDDVMDPLNAADDAIQGSHQYESGDSIRQDDRANLSVNVTGWLLDHLDRAGTASIAEIIADQYGEDPETVLSWVA
jgi:hypothetical protein